ncbi:MAG TPA: FCD domain-containing protein [Pseudonocardiaceae bacterium]|nr:FCD domain-containing protein [Pseudonocardiaceae bacterium]
MVTRAARLGAAEPEDAAGRQPDTEPVAERLLRHLAEAGLRPGDRLPAEPGLAELLGASRAATREAVAVLAAIGRLSPRPGAGVFVATGAGGPDEEELIHFQPADPRHVHMLLDYRELVESETARRAATFATPIEVRAIRAEARASARAGRRDDAEEFAVTDLRFHTAVARAAHSVFLHSAVATTRRFAAQSDALLFPGISPGPLAEAGKQHVAIAEAVADGDTDRAAELMCTHVRTTRHQFEHRIRDRLFAPRGRRG